jgi:hypothetical protein
VAEGGDDHGDAKVGDCFGGGEARVAVYDAFSVERLLIQIEYKE